MGMNAASATSVRLQKVIAASGLSSRRAAEALIREGQVTVNGRVVRTLGTCINPEVDHVKVKGRHLETAEPEVFVLLNKPPGCVTTMKDPLGRSTIADLLERVKVRVFPVGRLDYDAEGLLLLTNNGQVAQACLHPRYHVPKTYLVKVSGVFEDEEIRMLEEGVPLDDGMTSPASVKKSGKSKANSWLEITIHEGKKHQIKRMVEACGHRVIRIKRIRFGPLQLRDLPLGSFRYASDAEANALREILRRSSPGAEPRSSRSTPSLKSRRKAGNTPSFPFRRKPKSQAAASNAFKTPGGSATRRTAQAQTRPTGSPKKAMNPGFASDTRQRTKGTERRSALPKRMSNPLRKTTRTSRPRRR